MNHPVQSTSQLARFQAEVARAIMMPLGPGDIMSRENRRVATEFVKPNDRLGAADRLQIYNQQYWWRLLASFGEDFSGLRAILGPRKFHRLACAYLKDCGSTSWNLGDLGLGLAAYLETKSELIAPYEGLARDMVAVELARMIAFDRGDKAVIDPNALASCMPSKIKLRLQPWITLLELRYPIDYLLLRLKRSESLSSSHAVGEGKGGGQLRLYAKEAAHPIYLAVHRSDWMVYYKRLEPEAYRILILLRAGKSLGSACKQAFAASTYSAEEISVRVQTWFAAWTAFGWLCK